VTRLGTLLATAAPLLAWTAIALPADAVAAHRASSSGATRAPHARTVRARSKHHTRAFSPRKRSKIGQRAPGDCRRGATTQARARNCRSGRTPTPADGTRPTHPSVTRKNKVVAPNEAAQSQAVRIAKVLATPCQNAQMIPEPGNLALVRAAVLCLINTERARNGEGPLTANPQLEQAAAGHGQEMISRDYFAHVSPSGLTPVERIRTTGYIPDSEVGYVIGENLAWGTLSLATPQAIVSAWVASPEHLANILEGKYSETGIDVEREVPASLAQGAAGALYTQEFGVIVR
jgi:uncharacterized protein YkwD